jgi:hypothetical protein
VLSCSLVTHTPSIRIATDTDGIARLRQLVAVLDRLAHPSVIALVSHAFTGNRAEVELEPIEGKSIDQLSDDVEVMVKAFASCAAALAHVHDHGIALGHLDRDSFIVRNDHSVVVTRLDDAIVEATPLDKQNDVTQLAEMAGACVPETDELRNRINGTRPSPLRVSAVHVLDQARQGGLDARQLAEKLRHALWFEGTKPASAGHHRSPSRRSLARRAIAILSSITAVVLATTFVIVHMQPDAVTTIAAELPSPSCQLRTGTTVDVNGDGCVDSIVLGNGMITVNEERFAVGEPGDLAVIGDWGCNDLPTLALLRSATGEVFVFDEWPSVGAETTPRKLTVTSPASDPHAKPRGECDALSLTSAGGVIELDLRKATTP